MATFVLAHGAWSAAWAWKKVRPLLRARGHELYTPTLTGLGDRGHHASPAVDLETHVSDVVAMLDYEDLRDVVLIGHSYGGMVATGVADRVPERLRQVVYLDAFVPAEGRCLLDYMPEGVRKHMVENAADGWRVPANPIPPDTAPEDVAWIEPRRMTQPLRLKRGETSLPRSYIYCRLAPPGDPFRQFAERAKREGWRYFELDASHSPNVTAPEPLADLLAEIARPSGS